MVESWWRSRGLAPWKLQRICILQYVILGLMPNNRWMVMHFFMCIAVQIHRKIPKVQSFNSQVSYQKRMCMFYSSSWIIFLNLRITDQCQDRPSTLQHLIDFSKMFYFLQFHRHSVAWDFVLMSVEVESDYQKSSGLKVYLGRSKYRAMRRI